MTFAWIILAIEAIVVVWALLTWRAYVREGRNARKLDR